MKPLLILYFSGAGNTKAVAGSLRELAGNTLRTEIYAVEHLPASFSMDHYSAVILGTPTYHAEPAEPLTAFIGTLKPGRRIPAFLYTTCGLYSENCLRILARACLKRNIIPVHTASYRCSATDGMLLAPMMDCWFRSEKNLQSKIEKDFSAFISKLASPPKPVIPRPRWYTLLNYPNKLLGKATTLPIHLHREQCIRCGKCQKNCPRNAITLTDGYPAINKDACMNCYRCIHHCPALALSLSAKRTVRRVWSRST